MESNQTAVAPQKSASLQTLNPEVIAKLVIDGDLKGLSPQQRVDYYNYRCQQAEIDPAAKPFDLLTLNGKLILYANATCTQQLTQNRKLSHGITRAEVVNDIYVVCVKVSGPDGRSTENMGAVAIGTMKGDGLANAMMKATTKGIRRAVLAHCGLGMMDETETITIPGAQPQQWQGGHVSEMDTADGPGITGGHPGGTSAHMEDLRTNPFKRKYETVEEIGLHLGATNDLKDLANLYYINAELVEATHDLKADFKKRKAKLENAGK